MCIRDSQVLAPSAGRVAWRTALLISPAVRVRTCSPVAQVSGPNAAPDASSPVSYTHLTLPTICSV
eukprot:532191-Alexandrium_andersonii.AAC.1